jgi:hypothetical protein
MAIARQAVLTMRWDGDDAPHRGEWLCSGPRAKVAYEIAEVRKVAALGAPTYKLRCVRHPPADIPEGAHVYGIVWDKRGKR